MLLYVVDRAEVDEREAGGSTPLDRHEGALPGLEVELGRRAGRHDEGRPLEAYAGGVARVERAVRVEVRHVVPGVTGRGEAVEADHALAHDVDVLLRNRRELAPQLVEGVAVQPACARIQLGRVDQVGRSDLGDMDLE